MDEPQGGDVGQSQQKVRRKRITVIWRLLIGLTLIGLIIWRTDFSKFASTLSGVSPAWLLLGFVVQLSSVYVWALRWRRLLAVFEMHLPVTRLIKALFVGSFFSSILPTSFSGDFFRAYWVLEDKQFYRKSIFIAFVERFIGLVTLGYLILFVFFALPIHDLALNEIFLPLSLAIGLLCLSVALLHPAVFNFFNVLLFGERDFLADVRAKIAGALSALHEAGRARWIVYLYSFVIQIDGIIFFYCIGRALSLPLEFWHYFLIVPPTVLATMLLPISFNGLGVREGMLVLLTSLLHVAVQPAQAVALGVLVLGVALTGPLLGGAIYVFGDSKSMHEIPHVPMEK